MLRVPGIGTMNGLCASNQASSIAYRRFFGQPPIRDIKALRDGKFVAITAFNAELLGCPRDGLLSTVANSPLQSLSSRQADSYGLVPTNALGLNRYAVGGGVAVASA